MRNILPAAVVRCLFRFRSPNRASRLSRRFATTYPLHAGHRALMSWQKFLSIESPNSASFHQFTTASYPLLYFVTALNPPPSRLATLIRPFLEPNFPRRWSDSDMGLDARSSWPGQPGRWLLNPAVGPPPLLSLFPSALLNSLFSGLPCSLPVQASKMLHCHGYSSRP